MKRVQKKKKATPAMSAQTVQTPQPRVGLASLWPAAIHRASWMAAVLLLISAFTIPAHSQFGIDTALIISSLDKMNEIMNSAIGKPFEIANDIQSKVQDYQEKFMYPVEAIENAKGKALGYKNQLTQLRSILTIPRSSAQLPINQQLESMILSRDPNKVSTLSTSFKQVYGDLPSTATAPAQVVTALDMSDAQAQNALKKAIQLDAISDREMEVAQDLLDQIQSSSPGTVGILNAQASAWLLQGNAYSQSAMAEILRTRSAFLAEHGTAIKTRASDGDTMNKALQNLMQHSPVK